MPNKVHNPNARCRPDQLFGQWAIVGPRFAQMVEVARGADLDALRAQAIAIGTDQSGAPLYDIAEGVAIFEATGPLTKYETSFQSLFGGTSTVRLRNALRTAARDPQVASGFLVVDSPGGTVSGTSELFAEIQAFAAVKPIHVHVDDMMASAALWGCAGATYITASPGSSVGSIGAFATLYDTSGAYRRQDVKVIVVSSAPPLKGAFTDGTEITDEQVAEAKRQIDDIAALMVSQISKGRGMSVAALNELATGAVWIASKAKDLGLIDAVMTLDESMAALRRKTTMPTPQKAAKAAVSAASAEPAASAPVMSEAPAPAPADPSPAVDPAAIQEVAAPAVAPTADVVSISAAELSALRTAAARGESLARADRDRRFASLASDLGLPAEFAGHLDRIEAAVPAPTFAALESAFRAKNSQLEAKGRGLFTERGTGEPAASTEVDPAAMNTLADARVAAGQAKNRTEAIRQLIQEGRVRK